MRPAPTIPSELLIAPLRAVRSQIFMEFVTRLGCFSSSVLYMPLVCPATPTPHRCRRTKIPPAQRNGHALARGAHRAAPWQPLTPVPARRMARRHGRAQRDNVVTAAAGVASIAFMNLSLQANSVGFYQARPAPPPPAPAPGRPR